MQQILSLTLLFLAVATALPMIPPRADHNKWELGPGMEAGALDILFDEWKRDFSMPAWAPVSQSLSVPSVKSVRITTCSPLKSYVIRKVM